MLVFIDEVHSLSGPAQDSLLKATEPTDRVLLYSGGEISTRQVTFVIATTDRGKLRPAFISRFMDVQLQEYSLEEVVEILRAKRGANEVPPAADSLNDDALAVVAIVGRLMPRQALQYLREVGMAIALGEIQPNVEDVRRFFTEIRSTDDRGLTDQDRGYLRQLFPDRTVGLQTLATALGEDKSNLEQGLEPYLLRLGLITRERGGRKLTDVGRQYVASQTRM